MFCCSNLIGWYTGNAVASARVLSECPGELWLFPDNGVELMGLQSLRALWQQDSLLLGLAEEDAVQRQGDSHGVSECCILYVGLSRTDYSKSILYVYVLCIWVLYILCLFTWWLADMQCVWQSLDHRLGQLERTVVCQHGEVVARLATILNRVSDSSPSVFSTLTNASQDPKTSSRSLSLPGITSGMGWGWWFDV